MVGQMELPPTPKTFDTEQQIDTRDLLEKFRDTKIKIAIQKDGELTEISRRILGEEFQIELPQKPDDDRTLVDVSEDGETGFVYARNKSICELVSSGAVDLAIVGIDRVIEDLAEDELLIVSSYEEDYSWPLFLATPVKSDIEEVNDIRRIATQYPVITRRYLESIGAQDIDIVPTVGGTEMYPYLNLDKPVDAIVDMSVTGRSLEAHDLAPWTPSIGAVYPVVVRRKDN